MYGIFTYIYHTCMINVGKYTIPYEHLGGFYNIPWGGSCHPPTNHASGDTFPGRSFAAAPAAAAEASSSGSGTWEDLKVR